MYESVRLGRIAGIALGANWSVLAIFWLIAWALAEDVLPTEASGYAAAVYWVAGLVTAAVFLACLLAHELAHAVVARRAGIEVDGITLWMFGGVSRLSEDAPGPDDELRIAAAGPATSVVLGAGIGMLALVLSIAGAPEVATRAIGWLAGINLLLAAFNLLPVFPLDGGRVLRALVWRRSGDAARAMTTAATTGWVFGYVLIGLGIYRAIAGAGLGGVWLAFIGWIVLSGARAERAGFQLRQMLRGVAVADVMAVDPVIAPADVTVDQLVHDHVVPHRCSSFVLIDGDGTPAGLVTLRAVQDVPDQVRSTTPVAAVATPMADVATATPYEPLVKLLGRMQTGRPDGGRRALVVEGGAVVGIVAASDIEHALEIAEVTRPR